MKLDHLKPIKEGKAVVYHGKTVNPKDLTANFYWNNKIVPIGKFNPESYADHEEVFPAIEWDELKDDVIAQLQLSKEFTDDELAAIDQLDKQHFLDCIVEK